MPRLSSRRGLVGLAVGPRAAQAGLRASGPGARRSRVSCEGRRLEAAGRPPKGWRTAGGWGRLQS